MEEWISVKDRLPAKAGKVIVAALECGQYYHVTVSQFTGHYFSMSGRRAYWKVTHWMLLPLPPEKE